MSILKGWQLKAVTLSIPSSWATSPGALGDASQWPPLSTLCAAGFTLQMHSGSSSIWPWKESIWPWKESSGTLSRVKFRRGSLVRWTGAPAAVAGLRNTTDVQHLSLPSIPVPFTLSHHLCCPWRLTWWCDPDWHPWEVGNPSHHVLLRRGLLHSGTYCQNGASTKKCSGGLPGSQTYSLWPHCMAATQGGFEQNKARETQEANTKPSPDSNLK